MIKFLLVTAFALTLMRNSQTLESWKGRKIYFDGNNRINSATARELCKTFAGDLLTNVTVDEREQLADKKIEVNKFDLRTEGKIDEKEEINKSKEENKQTFYLYDFTSDDAVPFLCLLPKNNLQMDEETIDKVFDLFDGNDYPVNLLQHFVNIHVASPNCSSPNITDENSQITKLAQVLSASRIDEQISALEIFKQLTLWNLTRSVIGKLNSIKLTSASSTPSSSSFSSSLLTSPSPSPLSSSSATSAAAHSGLVAASFSHNSSLLSSISPSLSSTPTPLPLASPSSSSSSSSPSPLSSPSSSTSLLVSSLAYSSTLTHSSWPSTSSSAGEQAISTTALPSSYIHHSEKSSIDECSGITHSFAFNLICLLINLILFLFHAKTFSSKIKALSLHFLGVTFDRRRHSYSDVSYLNLEEVKVAGSSERLKDSSKIV